MSREYSRHEVHCAKQTGLKDALGSATWADTAEMRSDASLMRARARRTHGDPDAVEHLRNRAYYLVTVARAIERNLRSEHRRSR